MKKLLKNKNEMKIHHLNNSVNLKTIPSTATTRREKSVFFVGNEIGNPSSNPR